MNQDKIKEVAKLKASEFSRKTIENAPTNIDKLNAEHCKDFVELVFNSGFISGANFASKDKD